MKVKNVSKVNLDFTVGIKDGEPIVKTLKPGETGDIELKTDHPVMAGRLHAGAIVDVNASGKKAPPKPAAEPTA
jgi:hypothetical protein